jgi:hypothetical protein
VLETYSKHGVVFLGVPADEEEAPVRQAIARLGIPWDHLFDGRGFEGPLWSDFNVDGTPSFYVFDREGRIAAKRTSAPKLAEILETLTAK